MLLILILTAIVLYSITQHDQKQPLDILVLERAVELNHEAIAERIQAEKILDEAKNLNSDSLVLAQDVQNILDVDEKLQKCLLQLTLKKALLN